MLLHDAAAAATHYAAIVGAYRRRRRLRGASGAHDHIIAIDA